MSDRTPPEHNPMADLMSTWLKMAADVGGELAKMWPAFAGQGAPGQSSFAPSERFTDFLSSSRKAWEAAFKALSEPAAMEALLKGFQTAPELSLRLLQTSTEGYLELQRRWIERLKKLGASAEPYSFSDLDSEFLNRWTDIYKKEFRQFLTVPQLGLTKFYQEKFNQSVDKYNLFQAAMAEFLHLLFVPVEKSFRVVQEKLTELAEAGKLPTDSKHYYQMWIKVLEGHYMTLFQSHDYSQTMARTLDALNQFLAARQEVFEDALKLLPVSTYRDMDEVNREIYQLKRRIRTLEKKLQPPENESGDV
jgi:class III poly(R)-hydroxyalkanoic acid synthase PhaE subunit